MGQVPWGQTISLPVYAAEPFDGCSRISTKYKSGNGKFAILVDGSACNEIEKAMYAEAYGAAVVIIIHLNDQIEDLRINDAYGRVSIPSIVIQKSSGDPLIKIAQSEDYEVAVSLQLEFPFEFVFLSFFWIFHFLFYFFLVAY